MTRDGPLGLVFPYCMWVGEGLGEQGSGIHKKEEINDYHGEPTRSFIFWLCRGSVPC